MTARFGALGGHDVNASCRGLTSAFEGTDLAQHQRPSVVSGSDERSWIGEGMRNDSNSFIERNPHELTGTREVTDESNSERAICQLACPTNLADQPRSAIACGATDQSKAARR